MKQNELDTDDLFIEDVKITKIDIVKSINFHLRQRWKPEELRKGKEISVWSDWKKLLREDGSILQGYKKRGWVVFHYTDTEREWICFERPKTIPPKGKDK